MNFHGVANEYSSRPLSFKCWSLCSPQEWYAMGTNPSSYALKVNYREKICFG